MTVTTEWLIYIDIAVLVFYAIYIVIGAKKGFLLEMVIVLGTILAFYGAWRLSPVLADYFRIWPKEWTPLQDTSMAYAVSTYVNEICWFLILFIVFRIVIRLLEPIAKGLQKIPVIKQISRILGGALGAVGATIWIIVFSFLLNTPLFTNGEQVRNGTYIGPICDKTAETFTALQGPVGNSNAFSKLFNDMTGMSDDDRQAVRNWLDEHGYETTEEQNASPEASASSSASASAGQD